MLFKQCVKRITIPTRKPLHTFFIFFLVKVSVFPQPTPSLLVKATLPLAENTQRRVIARENHHVWEKGARHDCTSQENS